MPKVLARFPCQSHDFVVMQIKARMPLKIRHPYCRLALLQVGPGVVPAMISKRAVGVQAILNDYGPVHADSQHTARSDWARQVQSLIVAAALLAVRGGPAQDRQPRLTGEIPGLYEAARQASEQLGKEGKVEASALVVVAMSQGIQKTTAAITAEVDWLAEAVFKGRE